MLNLFTDSLGIVAVVLIFGGSIFIHELGHFIAARIRGLKVTRFSIGFGPKIFAWKGKDGCQYRLSLLPLGGYVALPQLGDMEAIEGSSGLSKEEIKNLKPVSFTDKVVVSAAGAFFNVLLAIVMAVLVYFIGIPSSMDSKTNIIGFIPEYAKYVEDMEKANEPYLKEGDAVLAIDGEKVNTFNDIRTRVALGSNRDKDGKPMALFSVLRGDETLELKTFPELVKTNITTGDEVRMLSLYPASKMIIAKIIENSPAERAGFQVGDEVIKLNGEKIYANPRFSENLNKLNGKSTVSVLRDGKEIDLTLEAKKTPRTKALCEIFTPEESTPLFSIICTNKEIKDYTAEEKGILKIITKNDDNDFAKKIKIASSLYQVGDKKVDSLADLNTIINARGLDESLMLKFINTDTMEDLVLEKGSYAKIVPPKKLAMAGYYIEQNTFIEHPSVATQISESFSVTYQAIKTLFNINSDIGIKHMSGPVGIGRVIYKISKVDIALLLSFTVLLNINLAILNMLPIPILDGGHILMAIIEKLTGKDIQKTNIIKITQSIFALCFLSLMVYIIYMDTQRWRGEIKQEDIAAIQEQYYLKDFNFENNE